MNRRDFLTTAGAASVTALLPNPAWAAPAADYGNLLILVELKGGNDALNTVVPYAAPDYYSLRPRLAIPRDQVLQLDSRTGLHPSLQALLPLWEKRELAIVQGVGYPNPSRSHFRSMAVWHSVRTDPEDHGGPGWLGPAGAVCADAQCCAVADVLRVRLPRPAGALPRDVTYPPF